MMVLMVFDYLFCAWLIKQQWQIQSLQRTEWAWYRRNNNNKYGRFFIYNYWITPSSSKVHHFKKFMKPQEIFHWINVGKSLVKDDTILKVQEKIPSRTYGCKKHWWVGIITLTWIYALVLDFWKTCTRFTTD